MFASEEEARRSAATDSVRATQTVSNDAEDHARASVVRRTVTGVALALVVWTAVWLAVAVRMVAAAMLAAGGEGLAAPVWAGLGLALVLPYVIAGYSLRSVNRRTGRT